MKEKIKFTFWEALMVKSLRGICQTDQKKFRLMLKEASGGQIHARKNPVKKIYVDPPYAVKGE